MKPEVAYADGRLDAFSATLPPHLLLTDRTLQRWAVSIGDDLPTETWSDVPGSRPPPLDDPTAIIVDQIYMKAPRPEHLFVRKWYKSNAPREVLAKDLRISVGEIDREWFRVLRYMRDRFSAAGIEVGS